MNGQRPVSRRRFLRDTGATAAATGAVSLLPSGCSTVPTPSATPVSPPPHRALAV
ncbi:MAG: twin-arginine translocation signal domain-containing protein, partial [Opitutaceae bacterium]